MLRLFFLLLFANSIFQVKAARDPCEFLHYGKFKFTEKSAGIDQIIERRDDLQIETDVVSGEENIFMINWISKCEYELKILQGSLEVLNFYKDKILVVRIIEIYSDGYKFESNIKGMTNFKSFYIKKIM